MSYIEGFPNGFSLASDVPIDKRMKVADITAAPADFLATAYVGLIVYDEATSSHVKVTAVDGSQAGLSYEPVAAEAAVSSPKFVQEIVFEAAQIATYSVTNDNYSIDFDLEGNRAVSTESNSSVFDNIVIDVTGGQVKLEEFPVTLKNVRVNIKGVFTAKVKQVSGENVGLNHAKVFPFITLLDFETDGSWTVKQAEVAPSQAQYIYDVAIANKEIYFEYNYLYEGQWDKKDIGIRPVLRWLGSEPEIPQNGVKLIVTVEGDL
ncbi:hypothetical protein [Vibrio phage BONAISHI]|nr:hypothetical protein [Vibrio phage BONAISHI]